MRAGIAALLVTCALAKANASELPLSLEPTKKSPWIHIGTLRTHPLLRIGIGSSTRFLAEPKTGFLLDLHGGALLGWHGSGGTDDWAEATVWLLPEVGYAFRKNADEENAHLGSIGVGIGFGNFLGGFGAYTPRLVAGKRGDEITLGFRHSLAGHVFASFLFVEISHQVLSSAGRLDHELLFAIGVNPLSGPISLP